MNNEGKRLIFLKGLDKDTFIFEKKEEQKGETPEVNTIWKYMSLEHALDMVEKQRLWLANPKKWSDPYERLFVDADYMLEGEKKKRSFSSLLGGELPYCTCFTSGYQNDAQWKMYCGDNIAVMIGFDAKRLSEALSHCNTTFYIGKAEYIKGGWNRIRSVDPLRMAVSSEERTQALLRLMLRKRINFKYEEEIRLMCLQPDSDKQPVQEGMYVKVPNLRECITRIRLQPDLGFRTCKAIQYAFYHIFKNKTLPDMPKEASVSIYKSRLFSKLDKISPINI